VIVFEDILVLIGSKANNSVTERAKREKQGCKEKYGIKRRRENVENRRSRK
jgi:hypothetical protein